MYRALPETVGLFGALPQVFHNGQASLFRMHDAGRDTLFSLLLIILFLAARSSTFLFRFLESSLSSFAIATTGGS
jgi:hypothetical protein